MAELLCQQKNCHNAAVGTIYIKKGKKRVARRVCNNCRKDIQDRQARLQFARAG